MQIIKIFPKDHYFIDDIISSLIDLVINTSNHNSFVPLIFGRSHFTGKKNYNAISLHFGRFDVPKRWSNFNFNFICPKM